jgi:hypothetical protein
MICSISFPEAIMYLIFHPFGVFAILKSVYTKLKKEPQLWEKNVCENLERMFLHTENMRQVTVRVA